MKYNNFTLSDKLGGLCENQNNLFTSGHEKHRLTVTIKDGQGNTYTRRTSYQFNPNFTKFEDGDGLRALVLDSLCYYNSRNFLDFCLEYGYQEDGTAKRAFNSCKSTFEFFRSAGLTPDDLGKIADILDN
jgi:hypothetical protein